MSDLGTDYVNSLRYAAVAAVNVRQFGAKGDGTTDDTAPLQAAFDYAFGPASAPNAIAAQNNAIIRIPAGVYMTSAPIRITQLVGGRVVGDGRFVTSIKNVAAGSTVVATNGCARARFEAIRLLASGTGSICFDLNWDNSPGGNALQSNTFADMDFDGADIGLLIGAGGFMGSETLIANCFFSGCGVAGIKTGNFNALQQTIVGGNISTCGIGIWVHIGSVPTISGVGFQANTNFDIQVDNSANDTICIAGCRSESLNFVSVGNGVHARLEGCSQTNSTAGTFVAPGNAPTVVDSCVSVAGKIMAASGRLAVRNSSFGRTDWLATPATNGTVEVENVQFGGTPNGSGAGTPTLINRQRITALGTQTYVVQ